MLGCRILGTRLAFCFQAVNVAIPPADFQADVPKDLDRPSLIDL